MNLLHRLKHFSAALAGLGLFAASHNAMADLRFVPDDLAVTGVNQSVLIDVLANDKTISANLRLINANSFVNGKAKIEAGKIRYTPNPGFSGTDTFRYNVFVNGKPATGTVTVHVGQGSKLTLVGQVVDEPVPDATVTVLVGGYEFAAQADENGHYSIDIASLQPDAFITMVGEGESASGVALKFYSVVGELARLTQAAGGDGVLTRDENNQVNITNLSTAQYVLLTDANNGQPVTSDEQLIPLSQSIDIEELLKLAAVIKLIVDEGVPLPAGSTDILDLIGDPAALDQFVDSLPAGQLEQTVADISSDPAVTPAYLAGNLPPGYVMLLPSAPGTIPVGVENGEEFTFNDSGNASQGVLDVINRWGPNPNLNWTLDNGTLLVTSPSAGWEGPFTASSGQCNPNGEYTRMERFISYRITRLQQGAGLDYIDTLQTREETYTDLNPNDACVPPGNGIKAYRGKRLGFLPTTELPFTAADLTGKRMLQHFNPDFMWNQQQGNNSWGAAIFDFDNGLVSIGGITRSIFPVLNNGRIEFTLNDITTNEAVHYRYARLQSDGRKGEGVLARVTRADNTPLAQYSMSAKVDGNAFATSTMAAVWRSGFDVSQFVDEDSPDWGGFFIVLNADGTGFQRQVFPDSTISENWKFSGWTVDANGVMRLTSLRESDRLGGGGPTYAVCPPSEIAGCYERRIRKWTPVAIDGDRAYVLEEFIERLNPTLQPVLSAQRPNFYERQ